MTDAFSVLSLVRMKLLSAFILLTLAIVPSSYSDTIPIRGPQPAPGVREAFEKFNEDAEAWNQRCSMTHSEAEQSWCERERAKLDLASDAGRNPSSAALG